MRFLRLSRLASAVALAGVCVAAGPAIGASTSGAAPNQTAVRAGAASGFAQAAKINPEAGSLSVGIGLGVSLADYQNQVARAESRAIDLGLIGDLLAQGCGGGDALLPAEQQPQDLRVEARGEERSADEAELNGAASKHVEATPQPRSRAVTTMAPVDVAGLIRIGGGRTDVRTSFVDGVRESVAVSEIGSLSVAGIVELSSLRWESVHRSGSVEERTGTFSIGAMKVRDGPVPVGDPVAALEVAGRALAPLGFSLVMPRSHESGGRMFVDPMRIGIGPNATRDALLAPLLGALQPVRRPVVEALFEADCRLDDVVTAVDVAVGSASGSGQFEIELGGVWATSNDLAFSSLLGHQALIRPPNAPSAPTSAIGATGVGAIGRPRPIPSSSGAAASPVPTPATHVPVESSTVSGERGGALFLAALAGVGVIAATAEGDRRSMRRAQQLTTSRLN